MNRRCNSIWVAAIILSTCGCASSPAIMDLPSDQRLALVASTQLHEVPEVATARFESKLPGDSASGKAGASVSGGIQGFFSGFLLGIVYPPAWMAGGPFFTAPAGAWVGATDARPPSSRDAPFAQLLERLQQRADRVGTKDFRMTIDSRLVRFRTLNRSDAPHIDKPTYGIVIHELAIAIGGHSGRAKSVAKSNGEPESGSDCCIPDLRATANWTLIRIADGDEILAWTSECRSAAPTEYFGQWFADPSHPETDIADVLHALAENIIDELVEGRHRPTCAVPGRSAAH